MALWEAGGIGVVAAISGAYLIYGAFLITQWFSRTSPNATRPRKDVAVISERKHTITVAELIEALSGQPQDRRVMLYDFEQHDQWLPIQVEETEVNPVVVDGIAKYGTGETIVSIGVG